MRRTHVVFGAGSASLTAWLLGLCPVDARSVWMLYWALLGSVLPDADLRRRHRALLHNILVAALAPLVVALVFTRLGSAYAGSLAATGLAVGVASHLLLDSLTVRGVALFYPFSRRYLRLAKLRSSSTGANTVLAVLGAAAVAAYLASCGSWW